ncbi:MAG: hypothetical protein FJW27_18055 [Acidimicrobiia bacterium]|nr:hypothetical protein [Acidimicrobiia bacterium]
MWRGVVVAPALLLGGLLANVSAQTTEGRDVAGDSPQTLAATVAAGRWGRFSTRITVRRRWVTASGEPIDARVAMSGSESTRSDRTEGGDRAEASEYLLERQKTGSGWKTSITVVAGTRPVVHTPLGKASLAEPPSIARI